MLSYLYIIFIIIVYNSDRNNFFVTPTFVSVTIVDQAKISIR